RPAALVWPGARSGLSDAGGAFMPSPFLLRRRGRVRACRTRSRRPCGAEEPAPERPGDQGDERGESRRGDRLAGVRAEPGRSLAGDGLAAVDQRAAAGAGVRAGPEEEGPVVDDVGAREGEQRAAYPVDVGDEPAQRASEALLGERGGDGERG